jgi:phosphohistidine phosphatase
MKKLTLIRHAKSSWKYSELSDHDRPLNRRGRNDAPMMGERLARRGFSPERIISSTALRALRTAEAIADAIALPSSRMQADSLVYGADDDALIALIQDVGPELGWLAIVGHNPGMTSLTRRLSGVFIANVPTCGVVEMHYHLDSWRRIGAGDVKPEFFNFDCPKNMPA